MQRKNWMMLSGMLAKTTGMKNRLAPKVKQKLNVKRERERVNLLESANQDQTCEPKRTRYPKKTVDSMRRKIPRNWKMRNVC